MWNDHCIPTNGEKWMKVPAMTTGRSPSWHSDTKNIIFLITHVIKQNSKKVSCCCSQKVDVPHNWNQDSNEVRTQLIQEVNAHQRALTTANMKCKELTLKLDIMLHITCLDKVKQHLEWCITLYMPFLTNLNRSCNNANCWKKF